jgi:hypothetical protein
MCGGQSTPRRKPPQKSSRHMTAKLTSMTNNLVMNACTIQHTLKQAPGSMLAQASHFGSTSYSSVRGKTCFHIGLWRLEGSDALVNNLISLAG